uniref:Kazal-like domain-containing protein n=1 Tax=Angiostrongylus cantonensis TaxID=6313 RepID=A0A0K0D905_ANGCA
VRLQSWKQTHKRLSDALRCRYCNGWNGAYPLRNVIFPNCDNENNQCQTNYFCVKIVDPITPGAGYSTYKGDCWMSDRIQVPPTNETIIQNKYCYKYADDAIPTNRYVRLSTVLNILSSG